MNVSLRKASAFSKALLTAASTLSAPKTIKLTIYSDKQPGVEIEAGKARQKDTLDKSVALTVAAYTIRSLIGAANSAAGVNTLLDEKASLEAVEKLLTGATNAGRYRDEDDSTASEVEARLADLKAAKSTERYGGDSVTVNLLDEAFTAEVDDRLAALRQRKTSISDELLSINLTTKVDLPQSVIELLKDRKLV